MRNHCYRILRAADDKTLCLQCLDQRFYLAAIGYHVFDIAANRETYITIGEFITNRTELAQRENVEDALGSMTLLGTPSVLRGQQDKGGLPTYNYASGTFDDFDIKRKPSVEYVFTQKAKFMCLFQGNI